MDLMAMDPTQLQAKIDQVKSLSTREGPADGKYGLLDTDFTQAFLEQEEGYPHYEWDEVSAPTMLRVARWKTYALRTDDMWANGAREQESGALSATINRTHPMPREAFEAICDQSLQSLVALTIKQCEVFLKGLTDFDVRAAQPNDFMCAEDEFKKALHKSATAVTVTAQFPRRVAKGTFIDTTGGVMMRGGLLHQKAILLEDTKATFLNGKTVHMGKYVIL